MSIAYNLVGGNTLSVWVKGKSYNFDKSSPNFDKVLEAVRNDKEDEVVRYADLAKAIHVCSGKVVEVKDEKVFYKGEELHNSITTKIINLVQMNLPFKGMLLFLENYMENPSYNARKELDLFLENKNLPVTEDGHFLAYKRVDENWMDYHTRTHCNKVGSVLTMPRSEVDDNPNNHCSQGFHAGAMEYVANFHSGGHVIIVKINPKDVVSVPKDCNCQKVRTCKYEVVDEYKGDLTCPMYSASVNQVSPSEEWDEDDEPYDEDDEYDDEDDVAY